MLRNINRSALSAAFVILSVSFANPNSSSQTALQKHPMAMAKVKWYADLSSAKDSSADSRNRIIQTQATGKVTATLDFNRKTVAFQGQAKHLVKVTKIELREARSTGDLSGPVLATLFDAHDGSFRETFSKTVSNESFLRVAAAISNGQAAVVVSTAAYPDGEIGGFILMHKSHQQ